MLTEARIIELASRRNVKAEAVRVFLGTVGYCKTVYSARRNMEADARSYRWNLRTQHAILKGIEEFFNGKEY